MGDYNAPADFVAQIQDLRTRLSALERRCAQVDVTSVLGSGFTSPNTGVQYFGDGWGTVHLRGEIQWTNSLPIASVFQLPADLRPANDRLYTVATWQAATNWGVGTVRVQADGNIYVVNGPTLATPNLLYLDQISTPIAGGG